MEQRRGTSRPRRRLLAPVLAALLTVSLLSSCARTVPGTPVYDARTPGPLELPTTRPPSTAATAPTPTRTPPRSTAATGTTAPTQTTGPVTSPTARTTTSRTAATGPTRPSSTATSGEVVVTLGDDGAIEIGRADAPVVIDLYEEPICAPCATFAERYGPTWEKAVTSGRLLLRVRLAAFLDERSASKTYSTRAIAALLAVVAYDRDPAVVLALQRSLFSSAVQPAEDGTTDLTNAQLAQLAVRAGASTATTTAIRRGLVTRAATSLAALTRQRMAERRITGTPAAEVDGRKVDTGTPDWLDRALR